MSMLKVAGRVRKCQFFQTVAAAMLAIALFSCTKEEEPPLAPVTLESVSIESIEVTTLPAKTEYLVGEEFEPAGMVVTASFSDNTTAPIDIAKATFIFNFSTTGAKTIMVAYEGKTTNFRGITVKKVVSITLNTPPTKTTYVMGEEFDPAGMVVFVSFDDLSMASIALSTLEFDYDFSETGTELTLSIRYAGQTTTFDGITVVPFAGGGIDGDPFLIGTAAQLAKLAELTNTGNADYQDKVYKLTADIDLSAYGKDSDFNDGKGWIPIGNISKSFYGNFDGGNHTVSGLYINDNQLNYAGLFGSILGGTITDLGITDMDIKANNDVGGIAGEVSESNVGYCNATGSVNGNNAVGGIAGRVSASRVNNCYAEGSVSGKSGVGGIAGDISGSDVINNYATGSVSGHDAVGGMVGNAYNSSYMTWCYTASSVSGNNYVGGIAGSAYNNTALIDCHTEGLVSGNNYVGGIAGEVSDSTVSYSSAYAASSVSGNNYVGGIAGEVSRSTGSLRGLITKCYAAGSVSGNNAVGGIAGQVSNSDVNKCYATGSVSGNDGVGGIAGQVRANRVTQCAALNPSIRRTDGSSTYFGRVAGRAEVMPGDTTLSGGMKNIALESMKAEGGITFGTGAPDNKDGLNLPTAAAKFLETYTTGFHFSLGWNFDQDWKLGGDQYPLPVLQTQTLTLGWGRWPPELPELPKHLQ